MKLSFLYLILIFLLAPSLQAQDVPSISTKTEGLTKHDGFFPVYWDASTGKVWLEIGLWETDFLYVTSLPAGVGSNDIGLDRGLLGDERVVQFERIGPKVLLKVANVSFRANSDNADERKAVEDALASSVVWGFDVAAQTENRVLVDATAFLMRDVMGLVNRLRRQGQGTFSLDLNRSVPHLDRIKAFPENTELEARLTFSSNNPGNYVNDVAIDPSAITVRMRQSLVKLPELGSYTPRKFDPRSGAYSLTYIDYAVPIDEAKEVRYTVRHKLEKKDPSSAISDPVEPIVYYLDRGAPEPVRSALLDGARWWAQAFEAAGYSNAFRVELLPEGADPLDLRYNVIQWVHRSTRGWSYGRSVVDPRTGEILKGHVSLGSLRVRQDYLIAEGLLAPYTAGENEDGYPAEDDPMLAMSLARLRQLSAHEIGHTLGFLHNFGASVNDRASVMDYPAPMVQLGADGSLLLDQAYDVGIGEWDKIAVRYSYSDFPDSFDEATALEEILQEAREKGYHFIADVDARPQGGSHPHAHLWDNGSDPAENLMHELRVREVALNGFGEANLKMGRPMAQLEEVLVPIYLYHRYQVEAAVKLIGGVDYSYTLRGDGGMTFKHVSKGKQLDALDALLVALSPEVLAIPEPVRMMIPPRPPGYPSTRELFDGHTGPVFDPYAPAHVVSQLVLGLIVNPDRAARLVYQHDLDDDLPDLLDVMNRVNGSVWRKSAPRDPYLAELQRITQQVWTDVLLELATSSDIAPAVRARVIFHLRQTASWLENSRGRGGEAIAHRDMIYDDILRVLNRDLQSMEKRSTVSTPPGSPIGSDGPGYEQRLHDRRVWLDEWTSIHSFCSF